MIKETAHQINVLITSPSVNTAEHVGGIATFTNLLIKNNSEVKYYHFVRGRKNYQQRNIAWFFRQPLIFIYFATKLLKTKNIDVIHINMPMDKFAIIRDTLLVIISSLTGKKIILHLHGGKYSMNRSIPYYLKKLMKLSIKLSDRVITLGNAEAQFVNNYYDIRSNNVRALYNAVKIPEKLEKQRSTITNILFLGRIEKNKGLNEIILALKSLSDKYNYKFFIAGEGTYLNQFLEECKKTIPKKYEFLGVVSGTEKQRLFEMSHIFLMPSYYEGLPYSLLEVMANKLVPIVTPVGSIPEIVKNGTNGFIVPLYNHIAISNRISQLIDNPELMKQLSDNAYNAVKEKYSLDIHIHEINKIYTELAALS